MPAITLRNLSIATPDGRNLLQNLDLTFGPVRTGLVGRNGTGKTTLLCTIAGELLPKAGKVLVDGRVGVLRQQVQNGDATIADTLGVADSLMRLERIEHGGARDDDFERADWTLESRVAQILAQLGLPSLAMDRPVATLSGGQRTRLTLAALLLAEPDFLLLDEPTNNLDADGRRAVSDMLRNWHGGAIVVSHDRELLRGMDQILELTTLGAKLYGGNWDAYRARQALDLSAAEHDLATAERQLDELARKAQARAERKSRADGRGKAKAARGDLPRILLGGMKNTAEQSLGAQSRLAERQSAAATADLAAARAEIEVLQPLSVTLESAQLPLGRTVLEMRHVTGGPGESAIIRDLDLVVTGPERVVLTGPNGSGKTTLLRLATGRLAPVSGLVRVTASHALLDQAMALLNASETIRENYLRLNPGDTENACRAALARFAFRAEAALKQVGELSGGEMLRAGLAATIGSSHPPELLILDEPTNHLDIDAIAAVEAGLAAYDGALLIVSHDRAFIDAIRPTREIALK